MELQDSAAPDGGGGGDDRSDSGDSDDASGDSSSTYQTFNVVYNLYSSSSFLFFLQLHVGIVVEQTASQLSRTATGSTTACVLILSLLESTSPLTSCPNPPRPILEGVQKDFGNRPGAEAPPTKINSVFFSTFYTQAVFIIIPSLTFHSSLFELSHPFDDRSLYSLILSQTEAAVPWESKPEILFPIHSFNQLSWANKMDR